MLTVPRPGCAALHACVTGLAKFWVNCSSWRRVHPSVALSRIHSSARL